MGKLPLTTPRGAPPPLDIVTAPGIETAPHDQPVSEAVRGAVTHPGIADHLNTGLWFADASTAVLFVDASTWLLFLHLLTRSDLVQARAERTFAYTASSLSFRADLSGSLSILAGIFFERVPRDWSDEYDVQRLSNCGKGMAISENVLVAEHAVPHPPQISSTALFVGVWISLLRPGGDAATLGPLSSICEWSGLEVVPVWATSSTYRLALGKNSTTFLICFPCRPQEASCPAAVCPPREPQPEGRKGRKRYV